MLATPPTHGVRDLQRWLAGDWTLRRTINDAGDGFDGTASFTVAAPGELLWEETGLLRLGAHTGPASRRLSLSRTAGADRWDVNFDDGRFFHDLDLTSGEWTAEHLCGSDAYAGRFAAAPDALTISWRIRGPGRDDIIRSEYRRQRSA